MNAEAHKKANELKAQAEQVQKDANNYRMYIRIGNAACRGMGPFASGELGKQLLEAVSIAEQKVLEDLREQYKRL